jgi:tetratricopeptide (TPR) repeat protein
MKYTPLLLVGFLALCGMNVVVAQEEAMAATEEYRPISMEVREIKDAWAEAKYTLQGEEQVKAFERLLSRFEGLREAHPQNADWDLWEGTALSTFASLKGGMGALKMVTQAKNLLESSLEQSPYLEDGLAYGVLGTLYYRVPSWPVGFKDAKKAKKYLQKAVASAPRNIDANFYYGEYLASKKEYKDAEHYLTVAMKAPHRPDREVSDMGRRLEIQKALDDLSART